MRLLRVLFYWFRFLLSWLEACKSCQMNIISWLLWILHSYNRPVIFIFFLTFYPDHRSCHPSCCFVVSLCFFLLLSSPLFVCRAFCYIWFRVFFHLLFFAHVILLNILPAFPLFNYLFCFNVRTTINFVATTFFFLTFFKELFFNLRK